MQKKLKIILISVVGIIVVVLLVLFVIKIGTTRKTDDFSHLIQNLESIQEFTVSARLQLENEIISLEGSANKMNNTFLLTKGGLSSDFDSIKYTYKKEEQKIDYEIYLNSEKIYETSILDIPDVDEYNINFFPSKLIDDLEHKDFKKISEDNYQIDVSFLEWRTYDNFFQILHGQNYIQELDNANTMDLFLEDEKITKIVFKSLSFTDYQFVIELKY